MDTNENSGLLLAEEPVRYENSNLLFKEEVFRIVGAALEVLNYVGHGFHEKPYENALSASSGCAEFLLNRSGASTWNTRTAKSGCTSQTLSRLAPLLWRQK